MDKELTKDEVLAFKPFKWCAEHPEVLAILASIIDLGAVGLRIYCGKREMRDTVYMTTTDGEIVKTRCKVVRTANGSPDAISLNEF